MSVYNRYAVEPEETRSIGKYGRMRKRYLEKHHRGLYTNLLTSCRLWTHLANIEEEAQDFMEYTVREMAKVEGVTEVLKAADQMEWVRRISNIRNRAEEILFREIICV